MKSRSRIGKAHLQLVFLPVDNDGGDLLVHEEEDGEQEGRYAGQEVDVPKVRKSKRIVSKTQGKDMKEIEVLCVEEVMWETGLVKNRSNK